MADKPIEHTLNPYGDFCAECEEPWPCEVTRLRAEYADLLAQANQTAGIYEKEINMLRAKNERLRTALEEFLQIGPSSTMGDFNRAKARAYEVLGAGARG